MTHQPASTAPLAAGLSLVQGKCPACAGSSLFLGNGGYVTCSRLDCPEPDAASTLLEQPAAVSAAVPPPADRAAVLRDFVRQLTDRLADCCTECDACAVIARDLADAELRRMADEAQPATEAPAVPVHACPGPDDAGRMPCCGRPPHETLAHRITVHTHHVTCTGPTK